MLMVFVFYLSYSIMCPTPYDIVLHYHTVFYFFLFFFDFVPYTYTTCRGDVCYVRILDYGRRGDVGNAVEWE
jgi:hypothetical protein